MIADKEKYEQEKKIRYAALKAEMEAARQQIKDDQEAYARG